MQSNLHSATASSRLSLRRALIAAGVLVTGLSVSPLAMAQAAQTLTETQATMLPKLVVTATRGAKNVLDVPMTVSVIPAEELDKRVVRDIQDLVRHEPGVVVDRQTSITNPWGQLNSFSIRGMGGNRVQMLVDGSRIQERITDGSRDFVDPSNMKSIEIVRGPNSVLWGADALGGVVSFQTKDPSDILAGHDKPWAVEMRTSFDSFDNSWRKQVTAAYDFGDVQVMGSFGQLTNTQPDMRKSDPNGGIWGCPRPSYFRCNQLFPADTTAYNGLVKAVWTPNADHEIKVTGEFYDRHTLVQQIWDSGAAANGIPTNTAYVSNAYPRDLYMERFRVAIEHDWKVDAPWLDNVNWKFSYSPQSRKTESTAYRTYANRQQRVYQLRDYNETFYEADLQLESSFDVGATSHKLTYGFDGDLTKGNYEGVTDTYRSDTGVTTHLTNQGFSFPRVETMRADFYVQDEIKLLDGRLTLTPGVRLANYSIDPTGDASYPGLPGFRPAKVNSTELLKKFGAVFKLDDSYSVYASYGEGFKMPTSAQLFQSSSDPFSPGTNIIPNPNLRPEAVKSYEAGIRGEFDKGWFSVGAFYSDYSDFILGLQPVPGPGTTVTSLNVSNVRLWGIEVGGEFEVYENLFATANLSYQRGVQKTVPGAPETAFDGAVPLTAVLGVRYEIPEHGLELELVGTFAAGPTERVDPNAFKPDGFAVFDAFATWKPTENVKVNFGVQNIFDTRYFPNTLAGYGKTTTNAVAGVNPLELQVAPGRTFKVGTTVSF